MNIEIILKEAQKKLDGRTHSKKLDAEILLKKTLSVSRSFLISHKHKILTNKETKEYFSLVERRLDKEPIAYIIGEKEFWSLQLKVSSATLVPRPETELLVEETVKIIPKQSQKFILELGTGCGAIAIAIAKERPLSVVVASDISMAALKIAKKNINKHQTNNVFLTQGDWLNPIKKNIFDFVVVNPPYIPSNDNVLDELQHEPINALVSGHDGLDAIRQISKKANTVLAKNGTLIIEHGYDQEFSVKNILQSNAWKKIHCISDLQGNPRTTIATL